MALLSILNSFSLQILMYSVWSKPGYTSPCSIFNLQFLQLSYMESSRLRSHLQPWSPPAFKPPDILQVNDWQEPQPTPWLHSASSAPPTCKSSAQATELALELHPTPSEPPAFKFPCVLQGDHPDPSLHLALSGPAAFKPSNILHGQ